MTIGASLGSFKGLELELAIDLYSKLSNDFELGAVEIRLEKAEGRPSAWSWEIDDKISRFLANFRVTGAHLPFTDLNPISPNPAIRNESVKQLKIAMDKAAELNMSYAVMHASGFTPELPHAQQLNKWEGVIAELTEYAEKRSILLTIENGGFLGNLKELATVVRKINSKRLRITLDVGHAHARRARQINHLLPYSLGGLALKALDMTPIPFLPSKYMPYQEYGSLKSFLKSEPDLIYNLHVHDYNGRKDHITIGSGKVDFSFIPLAKNLPLIIEVDFEKHYRDFKRNYENLINLIG